MLSTYISLCILILIGTRLPRSSTQPFLYPPRISICHTSSHHSMHPSSLFSSVALSIQTQRLHNIASTAQSAFNNSSTTNKGVFLTGLSIDGKNLNKNVNNYNGGRGMTISNSTRPCRTQPNPVFALSYRLLALLRILHPYQRMFTGCPISSL